MAPRTLETQEELIEEEQKPASEQKPAPAQPQPTAVTEITAAPDAQAGALSAEAKEKEALRVEQEQEALRNLPVEERFKMPISLDLRNIDILEALKFVATKGQLNVVATKNVSGRVTLSLNNVALRDVLDLMLRSNGLAMVRIGDIFSVMTEAEYKAQYGRNFADIRKVRILRLSYAIPEQAFSLLDALKSEIGRVLVDQESGNVMIMDTPANIEQIETALKEFEKENLIRVFVLKYAKAKDVEEILKVRLDAKKVGSIKADERNNQVIVQALAQRMEEVEALIVSLDKPTKEVMIDAKIVKVKLSNQLDRGFEWEGLFGIAKKYGTTYLGSYPFIVNTSGASTPTFQTRSSYYNTAEPDGTGGDIGSYPFSNTTSSLSASSKVTVGERLHLGIFNGVDRDFDVLLQFLDTIGTTKVLSNPKIVVVNNQEAKIHIGERQAYVTTTTTTGQTTSTISEEVTFVDVGIQLSVTANINDDGVITMKVRPEISSVSSILVTPTNNKIPIIDTSVTETTVMMRDGTTLLIGGLRKDEKTDTASQTPVLGKLPVVGNAFKSGTYKTDRTELLVMITPHIISGDQLQVGGEHYFGEKPGKDYREYEKISSGPKKNEAVPAAPQVKVQPKEYREYPGMGEAIAAPVQPPIKMKGIKE